MAKKNKWVASRRVVTWNRGIKGFDVSGVPWVPMLAVGGGLLLLKYGFLDPMLEALGLKKSKGDLATDAARVDWWWSGKEAPELAGKTIHALKAEPAAEFASQLYRSMDFVGTDESRVYSVFVALGYKTHVAALVSEFRNRYNEDLYEELVTKLSNDEFAKLQTIIKTKPDGIV